MNFTEQSFVVAYPDFSLIDRPWESGARSLLYSWSFELFSSIQYDLQFIYYCGVFQRLNPSNTGAKTRPRLDCEKISAPKYLTTACVIGQGCICNQPH